MTLDDKNRIKNNPDSEHYSDTWMDISEEITGTLKVANCDF